MFFSLKNLLDVDNLSWAECVPHCASYKEIHSFARLTFIAYRNLRSHQLQREATAASFALLIEV